MRDIKFRGKRVDTHQFEYGFFWKSALGVCYITNDKSGKGDSWLHHEIIPESLGQLTGLKDNNGREIYEGDILKIIEEDEDSVSGIEDEYIGEVVFGNGNKGKYISLYPASFCVLVEGWYMDQGLLGNQRHIYEVIGNIYQTPELLNP